MTPLRHRIALMAKLGEYISGDSENLYNTIEAAYNANAWFTPEYTRLAMNTLANTMLKEHLILDWVARYPATAAESIQAKTVGIVMAGNIPLVGFHDFLCAYISGHNIKIKLSSKDTVLWKHLLEQLATWDAEFGQQVEIAEMLKNCDAYIATGSNNSARYFEYYFKKYPHIIRKNRSSVAILDGEESEQELAALAQDINLYFGLGCRNVTKLYVPKNYNFESLLTACNAYISHIDHNKFKNNYDYQLALFLLNKQYYMTNGHLLLVESEQIFSPISVVHYEYYDDKKEVLKRLAHDEQIQCIAASTREESQGTTPFGNNQQPGLCDYADGVDTMAFLAQL